VALTEEALDVMEAASAQRGVGPVLAAAATLQAPRVVGDHASSATTRLPRAHAEQVIAKGAQLAQNRRPHRHPGPARLGGGAVELEALLVCHHHRLVPHVD
jgi:hypothetical protein